MVSANVSKFAHLQGSGNILGAPVGGLQRANLSFTANYLVWWEPVTNKFELWNPRKSVFYFALIDEVSPTSWTLLPSHNMTNGRNGNFIEFKIPLTDIGEPNVVYVCGDVMLNSTTFPGAYNLFPDTTPSGNNTNFSLNRFG